MNALFVFTIASLASLACGSGIHGLGLAEAAVVSGPSGVVTNAGAIGPAGHGLVATGALGLGHGGLGLGLGGLGLGGVGLGGVGLGGLGLGLGGLGLGHGAVLAGPVVAGPALGVGLGLGHGLGAVTAGGGTIGVGAHGAAIRGPPTAPVVVSGPSGKVVADGLWGPTANVGLTGGHGKGW